MENIIIRKSTHLDDGVIEEISYKTWLGVYPNKKYGISAQDIKSLFSKKKKRTINKNRVTYVAIINNKVIGYSSGCIREGVNQLQAIYILSKYQNKGIGKMLINKLSNEFFDKNKDTVINVATYNTNAINVYKKMGFVDTGKRFSEERFRLESGAIIPEMELLREK